MNRSFDGRAFQARLERLDRLLQDIERFADPAAGAQVHETIQAVLEMHGSALERLLEHVHEAGDAGASLMQTFAGDDVVSGLLLLHGLHPLGVEDRVQQALESVRPYLRSHGGNVELLELRDGVARLRLNGSCHSCPSSAVTMQQTVEEAIYAQAPEVTSVEVDQAVEEMETSEGGRLALPLV
jgi:Fe-S cluster biogenesis protein NfuA